MAINDVLGIIFSNANDEAVPELTSLRTMGSVPFAGRYRLIDFPLSSMVNSGITKVGVITNSNYRSLMDHIGNGNSWDLARKRDGLTILPPFNAPSAGIYSGKADALYGSIGYISDSGKDYVLLVDCNIICSINYEDMLKFAQKKNADMVIASAYGLPPHLPDTMEYAFDETGNMLTISAKRSTIRSKQCSSRGLCLSVCFTKRTPRGYPLSKNLFPKTQAISICTAICRKAM